MITDEMKTAFVKMLCDAILESVASAGKMGAPGGTIYAALMVHGFTFDQFQTIMDSLVRVGELERRGQLYFRTANLQARR